MTVGGKQVRMDWTLNITSLLNLALLLSLLWTAASSYFELRSTTDGALSAITELKFVVRELSAQIAEGTRSRLEIEKKLSSVGAKLDALGAEVDTLQSKVESVDDKIDSLQ